MDIVYELTERDFIEALLAHRQRTPFKKWSLRLFTLFVFGTLGLSLLVLAFRPNEETFLNIKPMLIFAPLWGLFVWGAPRLSARIQYRKQPSAHGQKSVLFDGWGVHGKWKGGTSEVEWQNYLRYVESKSLFILYQSPILFSFVPKRAMTPEQISELRALVQQNIKNK